jgi:O-antigen/teichoic acid export membrane protein
MQSRKSVIDAVWMSMQPILLSLLSFPASIYIFRSLGTTTYGQWAIGPALIGTVTVLTSWGLRPHYWTSVAREPAIAAEELPYQLSLRFLLALLAMIVVLLICVALHYPLPVFFSTAITGCGLVFTACAGVLEDVLMGQQRIRTYCTVQILSGMILTALSVVVAYERRGPVALSAAYLSGPMTALVMYAVAVHGPQFRLGFRLDIKRYRVMLSRVRLVSASAFLATGRDRAEPLILPKLVGIPQFGAFSIGSILPDRLISSAGNLPTPFMPAVARNHKTNYPVAATYTARALLLTLIVTLPLTFMTAGYAAVIASVLLPKAANTCRDILAITIWALPLSACWQTISCALQAANAHDAWARSSMWTSIFSLALALSLTYFLGVRGACLSYVARPILGILFTLRPFYQAYPGVIAKLRLHRFLVCSSALAVFLLFVRVKHPSSLALLTTTAGLSMAAYCLLLLGLRVLTLSELKQLIRKPKPEIAAATAES